MADIGLVGFPNAGKSSLLERFTNARPKIAPYPFTTKIPNLGVLRASSSRRDDTGADIILADIPGLIEGASGGAGLGIRFFTHISRTRALLFLIDLQADNYLSAFETLLRELAAFSPDLAAKKRVIAGTKLDLEGTGSRLEELKERLPGETVLGISVFSGTGLGELASRLELLVSEAPGKAGEEGDRSGPRSVSGSDG
jgi:GTP-binding protein